MSKGGDSFYDEGFASRCLSVLIMMTIQFEAGVSISIFGLSGFRLISSSEVTDTLHTAVIASSRCSRR